MVVVCMVRWALVCVLLCVAVCVHHDRNALDVRPHSADDDDYDDDDDDDGSRIPKLLTRYMIRFSSMQLLYESALRRHGSEQHVQHATCTQS